MTLETADRAQLHKLFSSIYNNAEGERNAAATLLNRFLRAHDLHPADVVLAIGNDLLIQNIEIIAQLRAELTKSANEIQYWRRRADKQALHDAMQARAIINRWYELEDLVATRWGQPLPAGWRSRLAKLTDTSRSMLARWELGVVPIPDAVFQLVSAQPPLPAPVPALITTGADGAVPSNRLVWTEPLLRAIVAAFFAGDTCKDMAYLASQLSGYVVNEHHIKTQLHRHAPPDFLHAKARRTGPIDWPELWLLGNTLFPNAWMQSSLRALGIALSCRPPADLNSLTTPAQIDAFRARFRAHRTPAIPILTTVAAAP